MVHTECPGRSLTVHDVLLCKVVGAKLSQALSLVDTQARRLNCSIFNQCKSKAFPLM